MRNKEKREREKMRRDCQFNYSPLRAWPWKDVTCYLSKYSWNCPTDWETYCKSRGTNQRAAIKIPLNIIYNAFIFRTSTLGNRLLQLYRRERNPPLTIRGEVIFNVPSVYALCDQTVYLANLMDPYCPWWQLPMEILVAEVINFEYRQVL